MVAICLALNSAPSPCIQKARGDEHGSSPDLGGQPLSTVWVPQLHALPISSQPCRHLHCEAILYSTSYKYTLCWYRDDTFYITYILEWNLSMVTPMIFKKSLKRPLICVLVLLVPVWSPKRDHLPPPCDRYGQDFLYGYRWSIFVVFLQLYKHYTEDDPPPPVQFLQTPHLLGLYGEYFLFVKFSCRPTKIFWYYTGTHLMFIDFSCIRAKFKWTHCSNRIYCDSISYCCACSELLVQAFFKPGSAINKDHKEKYLHILAYASSVYDNEDGERLTTRLYIAVNYYTVELNLATIYFLELLLSSFWYIVQGWTVPTVDLGCTWSGGICIIKWSV